MWPITHYTMYYFANNQIFLTIKFTGTHIRFCAFLEDLQLKRLTCQLDREEPSRKKAMLLASATMHWHNTVYCITKTAI